jgi:hypothetical protein
MKSATTFISICAIVIAIIAIPIILLKHSKEKKQPPAQVITKGDYQLYLDNDSIYLYDNARRVGAFHYDSSVLSIAILDDNL